MTYKVPQTTSGYTGTEFALYKISTLHYNNWRIQNTITWPGYEYRTQGFCRIAIDNYFQRAFQTDGYTATFESLRNICLNPNKKILIQSQYLPEGLESAPTQFVEPSFGFISTNNASIIQQKTSSNGFVDATVHWKNYRKIGNENSYYSSVSETIISHSESGAKGLCLHYASASDCPSTTCVSNAYYSNSYTRDTGYTWFKIIQLD